MRNLIFAMMGCITLTNVAAWGSDDPMPECAKRLRPIQEQIQEHKKQAEQLGKLIDESSRKQQEETSEKALGEGPHDYRTRLIKSWMKIESDYDGLEPQLKDINVALETIAVWAAENQMQECIKIIHDGQQAVQKIEQQTNEMIDKMRDDFIQRFEKLKQKETGSQQETQRDANWVLWTHSSAFSYRTGTKESWSTVAAFGSKAECIEESKKKLKEIEKDGFKSQAGYNTAFKEDKSGDLLTVQYTCFPDTEDPRGKKGKGK